MDLVGLLACCPCFFSSLLLFPLAFSDPARCTLDIVKTARALAAYLSALRARRRPPRPRPRCPPNTILSSSSLVLVIFFLLFDINPYRSKPLACTRPSPTPPFTSHPWAPPLPSRLPSPCRLAFHPLAVSPSIPLPSRLPSPCRVAPCHDTSPRKQA